MNIDEMRSSREKAVVAFMKFTQYKKLHYSHLFCFYEGEDIKYYEPRIVSICHIASDKIVSFNCGGKMGVIKIYTLISKVSAYAEVRKAYFIDRDYYPSNISSEEVFETPGYSIENFYTSINVFERILKREFGMNLLDSDFLKCRSDYLDRFKEFHWCILELNAWLKCQRKIDIENGFRRVKVNFKVSKYFDKLGLDELELKTPLNKSFLEKLFIDAPIIEDEVLNEAMKELKTINAQYYFRGKFELEFMLKMITDLRTKIKKGGYLTEEYESVRIDPNGNPLTILSVNADTPDELVIFLEKYKEAMSHKCEAS